MLAPVTADSPALAFWPALARRRGHIIDVLIEERAPRLAASPAWPVLRPLLYAILDYRGARAMADAIAPLSGVAALEWISEALRLKVRVRGLERAPRSGRLVAVCNHPTGIADGIAVYDALKGLRPDLVFYANADAHRVAPRFSEILIPVEWVEAKRTRAGARATLAMTRETMEAERALVVFPSGRIARRRAAGLADPDWAPSAFSLARRHAAPILPLHLAGPWSTLFHLFDRVSGELRDITLFHEFLNKRGCAFALTIGAPIPAERVPADPAQAAASLKSFVERDLLHNPDARF
ncbi:MAG TPA: 1-acyl-sn-glycerol-3-phosphate acyltransferase [Caulobacteraceae bacterium]|nr:1-acyl-sn-glycerol-3-phosphate acyltransferase [Caulobacteraceae bacterium]